MFSGQIAFDPTCASQGLRCRLTQQLQLRPFNQNDAVALFTLIETHRTYLKQWLPWLEANTTVSDSEHFIRTSLERAQANNGFVCAICYDTHLVGTIGLNYINWHSRLSSLGYWLAEPYQGQGIMTCAGKAVLDYGFHTLNLNRIDIRCAAQNFPSQAVAKRLGLVYEGTLREAEWLYDHFVDHRVYSILKREWLASTNP